MCVLRQAMGAAQRKIAMKVRELAKLLERCDAEAEVVLGSQSNWPVEHSLAGIAIREQCRCESGSNRYYDGAAPHDVIRLSIGFSG